MATTPSIEETYNYDPFAKLPLYERINRQLIKVLQIKPGQRILDLASGTGAMTKLILEQLRTKEGTSGRVLCLDLSAVALKIARREVADPAVDFVQGTADELPVEPRTFHAVVLGNAIHNLDAKEELVQAVRDALEPGGIFAFNTAFYQGTYCEGTDVFYRKWIDEAVRFIRRTAPDVRRSKEGKPPARDWLTAEGYRELLERNGFKVIHLFEHTVKLTRESLEAIGSYSEFARGGLHGYPVDKACEAMASAVSEALKALQMKVVPRNWLNVVAQKA
ncbi:MAG TPA: methyltransferase domain-containing protein [Dehalococcoidia bacterium]